jgi:hypothetical protein
MVVRHLVIAGLCATASLAQAGVVETTAAPSAPRPAWSFGVTAMPAAVDPSQPLVMNGPGTWTTYGRYGDRGGVSTTTVFTGNGPRAAVFSAAPEVAAAPELAAAPAPQAAPAPAPAAAAAPAPVSNDIPFSNGPADTDALGNGGVTGGPSEPPPFTDVALGNGGQHDADEVAVTTPPASEILDAVVTLPAEVVADVVAPAAAAAPIPEPATGMLLLAGMLGAGALTRRRK